MELHSKKDFQKLLIDILKPLLPLYSPGKAHMLPNGAGATYTKKVVGLEGFSRPLWGLVPFWVGGGKNDVFAKIYCEGLANGANPNSDEYWNGYTEYDQRFVEMAAIACGLIFTPEVLWDGLSEKEKDNLSLWLLGINRCAIPACNWHFFRVLTNVALKKLDREYSEEKLAESLDTIESYYNGGGWYQDGQSKQKDYYVSFALHYYGLVYAVAMKEEDPRRSTLYKERAATFAKDFIYWFDENGAALPYGRSLTYRFAQASFWSACLLAEVDVFSVEIIKGIITRHLQYWMEQEIFDNAGVLTVGYAYPNLTMAERYNAPGSPYWALKTFLVLALPDSHPFWSADAAPMPNDLDAIKALPYADMLMHRYDGQVVAYPAGICELPGHGHLIEKYSKFAYSTHYGFSVAHSQLVLNENAPDSMLAFIINDQIYVRKNSTEYVLRENEITCVWYPVEGIKVTTTIVPLKNGHTRKHIIESDIECVAYDSGFAVEKFANESWWGTQENMAIAQDGNYRLIVTGEGRDVSPYIIEADPNTNILFRNTVIPSMCYSIPKGKSEIKTRIECQI